MEPPEHIPNSIRETFLRHLYYLNLWEKWSSNFDFVKMFGPCVRQPEPRVLLRAAAYEVGTSWPRRSLLALP